MTDKQYNDFFRSKLDDFSSGFPEHIWQQIKRETDEKYNPLAAIAKYIMAIFFLILTIKTTDRLAAPDKDIAILHTAKISAKIDADSFTSQQAKELSLTGNKANYLSRKSALSVSESFASTNNKKKKGQTGFLKKNGLVDGDNQYDSSTQLTNKTVSSAGEKSTDSATNKIDKEALQALKKKAQKQTDSAEDITIHDPEKLDRWFLYLFASPDIAFARITSDNTVYQQVRNQEATMQFSYTAGARLRINLNDHLSGNIGLQYSQVNEKVKMQNSTSNNRYKSIDVPLIMGYRIYKGKWEVDANAGITLNISSSYSGYISSISNEPLNISKQRIYSSNTGLSYYGGLQFLFNPGKRIGLFAEPYFKYQPGNIVTAFQPFEEHVQKVGMWLGARYRFRK